MYVQRTNLDLIVQSIVNIHFYTRKTEKKNKKKTTQKPTNNTMQLVNPVGTMRRCHLLAYICFPSEKYQKSNLVPRVLSSPFSEGGKERTLRTMIKLKREKSVTLLFTDEMFTNWQI